MRRALAAGKPQKAAAERLYAPSPPRQPIGKARKAAAEWLYAPPPPAPLGKARKASSVRRKPAGPGANRP